jgi:indole-3-glycerol phosphate synthase/phosphoribosylanthranilate isomerase
VCNSVNIAVLRKDFLLYPDEVDVSYRAGADAVLLIARILEADNMLSMAKRAASYSMTSLIEVRTDEDLEKLAAVAKGMEASDLKYIVCGVNSRDLRDFSIDLLKPCTLLSKIKAVLGDDARVIFESGIRTPQAASFAGSLGFTGMLLGEAAAKSPSLRKDLVSSFVTATPSRNSRFWQNVVVSIHSLREHSTTSIRPLVKICGLTTPDDVVLADSLGADFVGFIFASGFARNVCNDAENRFEKIRPILKNISAKKVAVITEPQSTEAAVAAKFIEEGVLDCLQLHGIEYSEVPQTLLKLPHYFVITSKNQNPDKTANELFSMGEPRFLQDSKAHDYQKTDNHLWLAGGITPENAAELINQFKPELIDVSGGIEFPDQTGKKDPALLRKFFENVR